MTFKKGYSIMSKLNENGCIPANTQCPFAKDCQGSPDRKIFCTHNGKNHKVEYSCALARLFDITLDDDD